LPSESDKLYKKEWEKLSIMKLGGLEGRKRTFSSLNQKKTSLY